jgi:Fe-S-cluster-containing hydrogenase component 2
VAQEVPYPGYVWAPPYAGIHVNYDKCNGCRICEGACAVKNFGEFNLELSRIKIHEYYGGIVLVPSICWGCRWQGGAENGGLDAPCVEVCPTDPVAITWHETLNIPVVNEDVCIQCGLCYEACAPRAMTENPVTGFPNVCTRCDGDPECVKQCPVQALEPRKGAAGIEYCYGTMTTEAIALDLIEHRFYPWAGMEDWKKVGV